MNQPSFLQFTESLGVALTLGQRTLAKVAFDRVEPQDLEGAERDLAHQLFGDIEVVPIAARSVLVLVAGARSGKSYLFSALFSLWRALTADLSTLAPGEVAVALIVAPDLRLSRQVLRYSLGAARSSPALRRLIASETSDSFVICRPDGGTVAVQCLPATRGGSAVRGRSLVSACLDESAFFRDESAEVSDADIFKAVAPRVLAGGMVALVSTPWAESGLLHDEFKRNFSKPVSAIAAHAPTLVLRDDETTRGVVQRETDRDPENAKREFGAEFSSSSEALFLSEDVDAAVVDRGDAERVQGVRYAASVDLATRSDGSVLLIAHRELMSRPGMPAADVLVVDCARGWRPKKGQRLDVDQLERDVSELANAYRVRRLTGDQWGADFFGARLKQRGLLFEDVSMAPSAQAHRFGLLSAAFRQRRIQLPNDAEFIKQLKSIRVSRSSGGTVKFAAPDRKGEHDDYPKCLSLLVEQVALLPVGGGDIRKTWNGSQNLYTTADGAPCLPPVGSREWLKLCYECRCDHLGIRDVEEWMGEPANAEQVDAYAERQHRLDNVSFNGR